MIQGDVNTPIGTKAIRLCGGQCRFVIEAFYRAGGKLAAGAKPVEEQGPVPAQHPRDLLDGVEAGAHDLGTPAVEERAGPPGGAVGPEGLEVSRANSTWRSRWRPGCWASRRDSRNRGGTTAARASTHAARTHGPTLLVMRTMKEPFAAATAWKYGTLG